MRAIVLLLLLALEAHPARAHDIYTGVHGFNGQLCCGADDCKPVEFRVRPDSVDFLVGKDEWVRIPEDRITYARIPGDDGEKGHFCGRKLTPAEANTFSDHVYDGWFVYCAFLPPAGF